MPKNNFSSIYLAWTAFQRRQESMRELVDFECWFYPVPKSGKLGKVLSYVSLFIWSIRELLRASPDTVWVQVPQVPALWSALAYKALAKKPVQVIADCHNAQLRPPWSRFPLALWALKQTDAILVHNEAMLEKTKQLGWPVEKVVVVEDVPAAGRNHQPSGLAAMHINAPKPWILFPGSFAADEPIKEIFQAARLAPEITFIVSGRSERAEKNGHDINNLPTNVVLPGFLSLDIFDDLLCEVDVVMGLTKEEGIQLSVCNEALGFDKPLVTSNTKILRKLFGQAAVLVDSSDPKSIVDGCRWALANSNEMTSKSKMLAAERLDFWRRNDLHALRNLVGSSVREKVSGNVK
jgi:glycosyltransferase involved in cell wall biosynthesis